MGVALKDKENELFGSIVEFIYRIRKDKLRESSLLYGQGKLIQDLRKESYEYYRDDPEFHAVINVCYQLHWEYFQEKEKK